MYRHYLGEAEILILVYDEFIQITDATFYNNWLSFMEDITKKKQFWTEDIIQPGLIAFTAIGVVGVIL